MLHPDFLTALFMLIIGCMLMFKTEFMWRVEHFFSVKGGQPSELYLVANKFLGFLLLLVSLVMLWRYAIRFF